MASTHRRKLTTGDPTVLPILLLLLLLVTARCVQAQSPPPPGRDINSPYFTNPNFKPSVATVTVVVICAFFFIAFFTVYFSSCARVPDAATVCAVAAAAARSRRQRGLGDDVISSFPTLVYSEVKQHKAGTGALECAVCLSEFENDETLKLLPKCDHVFHPDCIDTWLAAHVTCPVCRANLVPDPNEPDKRPDGGHVIEVDRTEEEEEEMRRQVQADLERIINMKRAKSLAQPVSIPRSHTTGHSLLRPGDDLDRFTLRLPESVRNEINLRRARSLAVPVGEGSSRMWLRRGSDGSSGQASRSIQLGRSERWPSVLLRTVSAWGRRGEVDGSFRGGGGSMRTGKVPAAAVSPLDCLGGGSNGREEEKNCHADASTSTLARV